MSEAEIKSLQKQIRDWQEQQFPNATLDGAVAHLLREIDEAAEEIADCFFLATQAEHLGGKPPVSSDTAYRLISALGRDPGEIILGKLNKNKRRRWPAQPDAQGVYEADK